MKKLKLDELEVASFSTTPQPREKRGTVVGNGITWDCPNTQWDCSIDFCSFYPCGLTTVGNTSHNTE